jgi:hypothetical protein
MFGPSGPVCQSCGMPMSKDPLGGGTEAGGGKTMKYCSYCYRDGKFVNPDMTLPQMMELVEGKLREMHFPGFMARWMTKGTPQLERWR